jgi:YHS domain-containing protein
VIVKRSFLLLVLIVFVGIAVGTAQTSTPCKGDKVSDPVCGLCVDKDPKLSVAYQGKTYYFCTTKDANLFKADPSRYVGKR